MFKKTSFAAERAAVVAARLEVTHATTGADGLKARLDEMRERITTIENELAGFEADGRDALVAAFGAGTATAGELDQGLAGQREKAEQLAQYRNVAKQLSRDHQAAADAVDRLHGARKESERKFWMAVAAAEAQDLHERMTRAIALRELIHKGTGATAGAHGFFQHLLSNNAFPERRITAVKAEIAGELA